MKTKIRLSHLLISLISIMPIIDSINGIIVRDSNSILNIGQVYRMVIMLLLLLLYPTIKSKSLLLYWGVFIIFMAVQYCVKPSYGFKSVIATTKLFIPILMIATINRLVDKRIISKKEIEISLDRLTLIAPLTIIFPYIFKVGYRSYESAGFVGFYYATNEISHVLIIGVMTSVYRLSKQIDMRLLIILLLNMMAIVLVGTKSGIAIMALFILAYILYYTKKTLSVKKLLIICSIFAVGLIGIYVFSDHLRALINRLLYIQSMHTEESFVYILTSGRVSKIGSAWKEFVSGGFSQLIFGWGLGGIGTVKPNIEMDFLDLLFATGFLGFATIVIIFLHFVKSIRKGYWTALLLGTSLIVIFGVGHVLFAGLGGMINAVLIYYLCTEGKRIESVLEVFG